MNTIKLLASKPLFVLGYCDRVVPASTDVRYVKTWRDVAHVYNNRECDRCDGPKPIASQTLWCAACNALPACRECGMPDVDGCEDGCGAPVPRWNPYRDGERFYTP